MNFHDLQLLSRLVTQHPLYLLAGGLVLAVVLFAIFNCVMTYYSEQNRILRRIRGHGVIYRLFRLEVLTLVTCLLVGGVYEYIISTNEKWGFRHAPAPLEHTFERGGDWLVLHAVPAMMIVAAGTFASLEILDLFTRRRVPSAAVHKPEIMIDNVPFPRERWTGHLLLAGTTRAGKSTALDSAIHVACAAGVSGLFLDNNGDFLSKNFNPKADYVLDPNDARCTDISFFNELRRPEDIERLAYDLVADGTSEASRYFYQKTRALFIAVAVALWISGSLTNGDFWASLKDEAALIKLLVNTEWDLVIKNAKSWGDIYSTAVDFFSIFSKLPAAAGLKRISLSRDGKTWEIERVGESIRSIVDRMAKGTPIKIFVPYNDTDTAVVGNFLSMVTSVFLDAVMALLPDQYRRIVVVVDELGELPEISKLQTALSKGGKYGLSCWIGIQNISQLRQTYGIEGAKILLGNCNSQLILRLPDPESSVWAADLIGKRYKMVTSTSSDHSSSNVSRREELRHQLLPNDIQHLPNLEGILIFYGTKLVKRVKLVHQDFKVIHPRHIDLPASGWLRSIGQTPKIPGLPTPDPLTILNPMSHDDRSEL